jgi:hypothetical protein
MKAVISKNQFNRIKNFINETKEIKKDEVIGKKKKSFPDLTGDGKVTKADILKGRGVELDEKKKLSKKQLRTFDIDNDGDIEADDMYDLRAMKKVDKSLDEGSDCGCGDDKDDTRYMFFSNLEQMMRQAKMLLDMDEDAIEDLLNNGHDWAADHIAEAKNNMDQVFDFIMNEMNGEGEDDSWDNEEEDDMMYEGMINEDYLELRSVAKKLYSFLKSKGIRVRLSRGSGIVDVLQRNPSTGERRIGDNTPIWDKGISATLKSDGKFINQSEINRQYYAGEISKDEYIKPINFYPEIIIQENISIGDDFSFEIFIFGPTKEKTNPFGTRKVFDEEKMKNYQKIVLDFLKQFNNVNIKIKSKRSHDTLAVYNVSAIEPSMNEGISLKKKAFVSKELKNHLDNNIPLYESEFKYGSPKHIELLKEVKELYNKGLINLNETDEFMINEDYLELRSIAKKLYSFLKSKGIRVKLSRGKASIDLFQMRNHTDLPVWDKGISATLKSDGKFINQSERYRQYYAKEISKDEFMKPDNFKPEIIINEHISRGDDFSFQIYIFSPTKENTTLSAFRTRKVFDEEKMKNYQKIVLDFLKQFNNVNIKMDIESIGSDTTAVYNVSAIEPSMNEGMSLKKKAFVSKELKNHLDKNIPLSESEFRSGSPKHIELLKEVKELYNKGFISLNETDEFIVNEFDPNPIKVKGVGEVYLGLILEEYESDEELLSEAVYKGRKVQLGKPFLTPDGPKKRSVYVRNDKGNVVKVNFGDPNMRIKKNNPARRKSFRARHKCSNPGPRHKAKYWSCRAW